MYQPKVFDTNTFRMDLQNYLKDSSTRKLAEKIYRQSAIGYSPRLSATTIQRLATGKKRQPTIGQLTVLCSWMRTDVNKYFVEVYI